MKNFKKIAASVVALSLIAGTVSACTSKETEDTTEAVTSQSETSEEPESESESETESETGTETTPEETETAAPTESSEPETEISIVDNSFRFTRSNFPTLDGSTSMKPMGEAIASVLLGIDREEASEMLEFHRTTQSFNYLMNGSADVLICAQPSQEIFDTMEENNFEYEMAPFATEALVFIVNANNPVDSLTTEQIQGIYTGEITNWSQVGGNDSEIVPIQRNHEAGSQVMMENLVMDGLTMMEPPTTYVATEMNALMEVIRSYDNTADAIGYSVYYYAANMSMADGLKIIAVDGVQPSEQTIADASYPFRNPYFVVINGNEREDSPSRILYNWLLSEEGQSLVSAEGYVPAGASESN